MDLSLTFTILWAVWGVIFAAIEIPALIRKKRGDTLTDHVFALKRWTVGKIPIGYLSFAGFWIWLTLHFWLEI